MTKQHILEKENGKQRVSLILAKEEWKALKFYALSNDTSMMEIIRLAIRKHLNLE